MWVLVLLERITRHWFLFFVIFGGLSIIIAGLAGQSLGIPYLFRDSPDLLEYAKTYGSLTLFSSGPSFLTQLSATFLIGSIWFYVGLLDHNPGREKHHATLLSHALFLAPRVFIFSLLPLLAAYFSTNDKYGGLLEYEAQRAILGTLAGYVTFAGFVIASHLLAKVPNLSLLRASFILSVLSLAVLAFLPRLLPVVALVWLLGCFLLVYVVIVLMPEALRPVAVVVLILWLTFSNGVPFKYRFEGVAKADGTSYYDLEKRVNFHSASDKNKNKRRHNKNLIDPITSLTAWKARLGLRKPKLVLVTTSGGAYRAAFWTALVLDKLRQESLRSGPLAQLTDHIRLVTGASGGMVSAAYFVASRNSKGDAKQSIVEMLEDDIEKAQNPAVSNGLSDPSSGALYPIPRDSLSSITQQLVQEDLINLFLPWQQDRDRGLILENHWKTLDVSFKDLKKGELEGWRPSIILSPVVIETGQPLLVSNLSLATIRKAMPKPIEFDLPSFPDVDPIIEPDNTQEKERIRNQQDAVEFFRLFPNAQQSFDLKTAVRMSASFAFISPAVALPTTPPRRIVDAGYYDNYGVSMAIAYLRQRDVMNWVLENTSGVMIIQIRAFPTLLDEEEKRRIRRDMPRRYRSFKKVRTSQEDKELHELCKLFRPTKASAEQRSQTLDLASRFGRSFQWLTSPFEGIEASRQTSMLVRNNLEIELLRDLYKEKNDGSDFIQTVVFENRLSTSLNWTMPRREFQCLQLQLRARQNRRALNQLAEFWKERDD